jgi:arginase
MKPIIALIGLPTDVNSSFERGPASAPSAIRKALWSERGNLACSNGLEVGHQISIQDLGDLPLTEDTAHDDNLIRNAVAQAIAAASIPFCLGGDHAVTFPILQAIAKKHGPVSILHFDAHPDLYDNFGDNPRSHASPFARIMEEGLAKRLVQVGVRTLTYHCRAQAERFGVEILPMAGFVPELVPVLTGPLYISLDLDGIDPSEAPGVSHPEPGGLTVREVMAVLSRQTAPIIGADIVELNPLRDKGDVTAIVAAKFVREIASQMTLSVAQSAKEIPVVPDRPSSQ